MGEGALDNSLWQQWYLLIDPSMQGIKSSPWGRTESVTYHGSKIGRATIDLDDGRDQAQRYHNGGAYCVLQDALPQVTFLEVGRNICPPPATSFAQAPEVILYHHSDLA